MLSRNLGRLAPTRKTRPNSEGYHSYQFGETKSMQKLRKIVVVSKHYPPDRSPPATIMSALAEHLATVAPVLVLSGTSGSASPEQASQLSIIEVRNWQPA